MAAAHSNSNRSPSPMAAGSRPINPNLRNLENNSAVRRSFSVKPSVFTNPRRLDPTTPANSPSDFGRRHSVDSYPKEKENYEKDHNIKPSKFHPSAKGSKHFMSPTISAASKFTPSPKKKVLVERNDPVRTSISLSDGKAMFYSPISTRDSTRDSVELEPKAEMENHNKGQGIECSLNSDLARKQAVLEGTQVSKSSKKVSFADVSSDSQAESLSESVITDADGCKMEFSSNNGVSCSSDSSSIAPLDPDPSLPPYDPITNYLVPRPHSRCYKPIPRVEDLINKEKGVETDELKQLEDSLLEETGEEGIRSDDLQSEELGGNASEDLVSCSSDSSSIAPLDADPSYDPKTNYLVPRPQFLHYKPNPRVEILINKEKGLEADELKQLEDSLLAEILSESFSDTEGAEDTQGDEQLIEEGLGENVSADLVVGMEDEIEDSPHPPESSESLVSEENSVKEKAKKKPRSVFRMMCFSMIIMFLIGCGYVFVFHSPAFDEISFDEMRFSDVSELYHRSRVAAAATKVNFDLLARHVSRFSVDSVAFFSNLVNDLRRGEDIGPVQFVNLSYALQDDGWSWGGGKFIEKDVGIAKEIEKEDDFEEDDNDAEKNVVSDEESNVQETSEVLDGSKEDNEMEEEQDVVDATMDVSEDVKEASSSEEEIGSTPVDNLDIKSAELQPETFDYGNSQRVAEIELDQVNLNSHDQDSSKLSETENSESGSDGIIESSSPSSDQKIPSDANFVVEEAVESSIPSDIGKIQHPYYERAGGISAIIAAASLLAVAAAAYTYYYRPHTKKRSVAVQEKSPLKVVREEQTKPCPSKMMSSFAASSSSYSYSYSVKETTTVRGVASEAQSVERKKKAAAGRRHFEREALATNKSGGSSEYTMTGGGSASASASPSSYGSFTTYERIPMKSNNNNSGNGGGEEEMITPVRRSSRIRNHYHNTHNQVTSP
ncbi:uncharacterized protein LOC127261990 [Andrographis paniculata]|uniref:uncharacterized protein LOC127261990 n=1 Tax=Andrographis paniculata TaxID=175694 RepID=UPI0021E7D09F|nr:uncharacterized protein LOC127261990 [Andrographis paniculata]